MRPLGPLARPSARRPAPAWALRRCPRRRSSGLASSPTLTIVPAGAKAAAQGNHPSADSIATVINWAYRGKYEGGDDLAWCGERHLLSGRRTTAAQVAALLGRCDGEDPSELLLLALGRAPQIDLAEDHCLLGTIHVQRLPQPGSCEIGMFSVDPDQQGQGTGRRLLAAAEQRAVECFGARTLVMHVLEGRGAIQDWYERCGYSVVAGAPKVPFPFDADTLSTPVVPAETLLFVRLEKQTAEDPVRRQGYPFEDYEAAAQHEREQAWARACEEKLRRDGDGG